MKTATLANMTMKITKKSKIFGLIHIYILSIPAISCNLLVCKIFTSPAGSVMSSLQISFVKDDGNIAKENPGHQIFYFIYGSPLKIAIVNVYP